MRRKVYPVNQAEVERDAKLLAELDRRFSGNSAVRSLPLSMASPPPVAEPPKPYMATKKPSGIGRVPVRVPVWENKRQPDCGHGKFKPHGTDRYGRARKRCQVKECGRTVLA